VMGLVASVEASASGGVDEDDEHAHASTATSSTPVLLTSRRMPESAATLYCALLQTGQFVVVQVPSACAAARPEGLFVPQMDTHWAEAHPRTHWL